MTKLRLLLLLALPLIHGSPCARLAHATVLENDSSATYVCSGASTYLIDFPFLEKTHIVVTRWLTATPAVVTTLILDGGQAPSYTVTAINGGESGTVTLTYGTLCETNYTLKITRVLPVTQTISFRSQGTFIPRRHEYALDKVTMLIQQAEEGIAASQESTDAINAHVGSDDHTNYFYLPGRDGGQIGYGGDESGDDLTLSSTDHATKGDVILGSTVYIDEASNYVGINASSPSMALEVTGDGLISNDLWCAGEVYGSDSPSGGLQIHSTSDPVKGLISLGDTITVDEDANMVGINDSSPSYDLDVTGDGYFTDDLWVGDDIYGGTLPGVSLDIYSTSNGTRGLVNIHETLYGDQTNDRIGINNYAPDYDLDVTGDTYVSGNLWGVTAIYGSTSSGGALNLASTSHVTTKGSVYIGSGSEIEVDEVLTTVGIGAGAVVDVEVNISGDIVAGDTVYGSLGVGGDLNLMSTVNGVKGNVNVADTIDVDETNTTVGIATSALSGTALTVDGDVIAGDTVYGETTANGDLTLRGTTSATRTTSIVGFGDGTAFVTDAGSLTCDDAWVTGELYGSAAAGGSLDISSTSDPDHGSVNIANVLDVDEDLSAVGVMRTALSGMTLAINGDTLTPQIYGGVAGNGDLRLRGTTNATRTTSYVYFGDDTAYITDTGGLVCDDAAVLDDLTVAGDAWIEGTLHGGDGDNDNLVLSATSGGTKGNITLGGSAMDIDDEEDTVGIAASASTDAALTVNGDIIAGDTVFGGTAVDGDLVLSSTTDADKDLVYFGTAKQTVYDEENERFGIGTPAPTYNLHVTGTGRFTSTVWASGTITSSDNVVASDDLYGTGVSATNHRGGDASGSDLILYSNPSDDGDIFIGYSQISKYVDATDRMFIGSLDGKYTARLNVENVDNSDYSAYFANDNDSAYAWGIAIQAGDDAPSSNSDVIWAHLFDGDKDNGTPGTPYSVIEYTTSTPYARFAAGSDRRLKKNIEDTDVNGLEVINGIRLRQFDFKAGDRPHQDIGYIAQEVDEVYPPLVSKPAGEMMRVGDSVLTPVLVKSVQELTAMIEALQTEVDELRADCQ